MHPLIKTSKNKFIYDSGEYILKHTPIGYDEVEQNIIRSKKSDGILFEETLNVKFVKEDKDWLVNKLLTNGVDQTIEYVGDIRDGNDYKTASKGVFSLKTAKWDKTTFTADLKASKFDEVFRANEKEKFELDRTTDINGNTISTLERKVMAWRPRQLLISAEFNEEPYDENLSTIASFIGLSPLMTPNPSSDDDMQLVLSPLRTNAMGADTISVSNFFLFDSSRNKEIYFNYDVDISIDSYTSVDLLMSRYSGGVGGESLVFIEDININTFNTNGADIITSGNTTIEVLEGESLIFWLRIYSNNCRVIVDKCKLSTKENFLYTPKFPDEKYVDGISLRDAMARMIEIMDPSVEFKSDYLDTYWPDLMITGGESVRHVLYDGVKAPLASLSFKDLFETMFTIAPVSFRIRKKGIKTIFEVEHISDFYRDPVSINFGKLSDIEYEVNSEKIYNRIEIGYRNSGEIEDLNGLLATHTLNTFTLPVDDGENTYNATCPAHADPYEAQDCYVKQFSEFPDTDTPYDKDFFVFDCLKSSLLFAEFYVPYQWQTHFSAVSGFYAEDTGYNYRLLPKNCLLRHPLNFNHEYSRKIYQSDEVIYTSTNGNVNASTTLIGGTEQYENGNLLISDLDEGLLLPITVTGTAALTDNLLQQINGGGDTQNIYDTATFEDDYGNTIRCHAYDIQIKDDIKLEAILKNG